MKKHSPNIHYNLKEALCIGLCLLAVFVAPIIFTRDSIGIVFDEYCAHVGETIGGITAPVVGLISIFLLYKTLAEQREFNKIQTKLQQEEQFKSTLFQLLQKQENIRSRFLEKADVFRKFRAELTTVFEAFDEFDNNKDLSVEELEQQRNIVLETENIDEVCRTSAITQLDHDISILKAYSKYSITPEIRNEYNNSDTANKNRIAFIQFYIHYNNDAIGFYCRHLYWILKILDTYKDKLGDDLVKDYAQFIQAQMSNKELVLVYYDCFAFPKLKNKLIDYNLLENLTVQNLITEQHYCDEIKLKNKMTMFNKSI